MRSGSASTVHLEKTVTDIGTLEIVSLEEALGESASCDGAKKGIGCDQEPSWRGITQCCGSSTLLCHECKLWLENWIKYEGWFYLCSFCDHWPIEQLTWAPA
jgi:hypothetical protein